VGCRARWGKSPRNGTREGDVEDPDLLVLQQHLVVLRHSGNVLGEKKYRGVDSNGFVNELQSAENGAVVFTASTGRQFSQESKEWGNGAFTKAMVEAIGGKADYQRSGKITVNMLDLYVSERVKEFTGGQQTPVTAKPGGVPDFPVGDVRQ
jgi:hypothetical protein